MTLVSTLVLALLAAAPGECYVVTNTRILVLPTCDIGPATIAALTEEPGPGAAPFAVQRGGPPPWRGRFLARSAPPVVDAGEAEVERRLELEQQSRITAVARRLAAERARDRAIRDRDEALRQLEAARRALAEVSAPRASR